MKHWLTVTSLCLLASFAVGVSSSEPLARLDQSAASLNRSMMDRIVMSIGRPDAAGLLGRNREWGALYSVRFQYGAGRALRHGYATANDLMIRQARGAINAGLASIQADGSFSASVPDFIGQGRQPGRSDQVSAAAFFLSDVCPAFLVAGSTTVDRSRVTRAIVWLAARRDVLLSRDQAAPNRLLVTGLAFSGCGRLLNDERVEQLARPFVDAALDLMRGDGSFIEAQGRDTSYQAVSLVAGIELATLGGTHAQENKAEERLQPGVDWLASRIDQNGVLSSSDNSRTCAGETFIGREKTVDLREVFRALAYAVAMGMLAGEKLEAFTAWLSTSPDPCTGDF